MLGMRRESDVASKVVKLIEESLRRTRTQATVTASSRLSDLGLDSMAKISLAFRIEEVFAIDLTQSTLNIADIRTVDDIIRAVTELTRADATRSRPAS